MYFFSLNTLQTSVRRVSIDQAGVFIDKSTIRWIWKAFIPRLSHVMESDIKAAAEAVEPTWALDDMSQKINRMTQFRFYTEDDCRKFICTLLRVQVKKEFKLFAFISDTLVPSCCHDNHESYTILNVKKAIIQRHSIKHINILTQPIDEEADIARAIALSLQMKEHEEKIESLPSSTSKLQAEKVNDCIESLSGVRISQMPALELSSSSEFEWTRKREKMSGKNNAKKAKKRGLQQGDEKDDEKWRQNAKRRKTDVQFKREPKREHF